MKNKSVSSSVGISIKPPKNFEMSGESEVKPEKKKARKSTPEEKYIASLVLYIQFLEEQLDFVKNLLKEAQSNGGCGGCGK